MTGILCAYALDDAGIDYTLIEAKQIGSGITENTTAKITAQHGLIYHKLIRKYGPDTARLYYKANARAVNRYKHLCKSFHCHFETQPAFVYSRNDQKHILEELEAYRQIGVCADFETKTSLPFSVAGAIILRDQGQLHPLEFLYCSAKGLNIKEHTKLLSLAPGVATTDKGSIYYNKAIIATHFPLLNKHGSYFLKLYQDRSYVLALENAPSVKGMYIDEDPQGLSFRTFGQYLLLGGGSHRTGRKSNGWQALEDFAKQHYPDATIAYKWAAQDCMTLDGMPYIGQYSANTPTLFTATGYNKWGFTSSMVAAELLCDLVQGKDSEFSRLFSPSRSVLHPQLITNATEAVWNLITPTTPRCPHLGCALKYNKHEHSWDCPCHGSRFSATGELLNNPATDDICPPKSTH